MAAAPFKAFIGMDLATTPAKSGIRGVEILSVAPNQPADIAGLRVGDVVQMLENQPMFTLEAFLEAWSGRKPGDTVNFMILRKGHVLEKQMVVGSQSQAPPPKPKKALGIVPLPNLPLPGLPNIPTPQQTLHAVKSFFVHERHCQACLRNVKADSKFCSFCGVPMGEERKDDGPPKVEIVSVPPSPIPQESPDGQIVLAYWAIRGLGQCCRLALELAGCSYVDVRIDAGPFPSEQYKQAWLAHKDNLGLPFSNLPFLLDGQLRITQSATILRYIGRKYNLYGEDLVKTDLVIDQASDFDGSLTGMCYRGGHQQWLQEQFPEWATSFEEFFACIKTPFVGGELPCIGDVKLFETIDKCVLLMMVDVSVGDPLAQLLAYPTLTRWYHSIAQWPQIKNYMTSERYIRHPMNNPHAVIN